MYVSRYQEILTYDNKCIKSQIRILCHYSMKQSQYAQSVMFHQINVLAEMIFISFGKLLCWKNLMHLLILVGLGFFF